LAAVASLLSSFLMMSIGWLVAWLYPLDEFETFAIWWSIYTTITAFAFDYIRTGVTRYAGGRHPETERAVYMLHLATTGGLLVAAGIYALIAPGSLGPISFICACSWAVCEVTIAQRKAMMQNRATLFLLLARTIILAAGLGAVVAMHLGLFWLFVVVAVSNILAVVVVPGSLRITVSAIGGAARRFQTADLPLIGKTFIGLSPLALAAALLNLLILAMRSLASWRFDAQATANIALSSDLGLKGVLLAFGALMIFPIQRIFAAHDGDGDLNHEGLSISRLLTVFSISGLGCAYFLAYVLKAVVFPHAVRATIAPHLMISVLAGTILCVKMYVADLHMLSQRKVLLIVCSNAVMLIAGAGAAAGFSALIGPVGLTAGALFGVICGCAFSSYSARTYLAIDLRFLGGQALALLVYVGLAMALGAWGIGPLELMAQFVLLAVFLATSLALTVGPSEVRRSFLHALAGR
jgi:hypothetical protein